MRIAMIGQKGIPFDEEGGGGGIERHVEELSTRLVERGNEVIVYVRPHAVSWKEPTYKGVRLIRRPSLKSKNFDTISHALICTLDVLFRNVDIIHYHGVGPSTLAWVPRLLKPGAQVVVTFHSQDRFHLKWGLFARLYLTWGEWTAVHIPHLTIAVSHAIRGFCREKWPGRTVVVIPNGVADAPRADGVEEIKQFGLTPGGYILTVARLIRHKGIHHLIQAYAGLKTDKKLAIVGAPSYTRDYYDYLLGLAKDNPNIVFTGFQTGRTLAALYQHSYLYVHASESEGLSLTILEAMSYATPVLISDIPENLETIDHSGFSFEVRNVADLRRKLEDLLAKPDEVRQVGERGQEFIKKNFNWKSVVEKTEAAYRSALDRGRRGR